MCSASPCCGCKYRAISGGCKNPRRAWKKSVDGRSCYVLAVKSSGGAGREYTEPSTAWLTGRDGLTESDAEPLFSAEDTQDGETPK